MTDFMPDDEAAANSGGASTQPSTPAQPAAAASSTTATGDFMPPDDDNAESGSTSSTDEGSTAAAAPVTTPPESEPPPEETPAPDESGGDAGGTGEAGNETEPPEPSLEGYRVGMTPQEYSAWYNQAIANGFSPQEITAEKRRIAGQQETDANGNPIGVGLGNWKPGDVYTGTGTSSGDFLMTDQTFTAQMPENAPTPVEWEVTDEQTVAGQMAKLTQNMQDNPLYQNIAASLERAQATHGGANSLMAQTAAYKGVVDMAFQIASQDAATYARSAEFNASTANQFALSNLQFMQNALLSTQNYQQAQVLQAQQIQGNLQSVSMQVAGQIAATKISAAATVSAAGISANATLRAADIQRQTTLDSLQINFQNTWALNEQQQAHQLEMSDRTTDNSIRHDILAANTNFGQQLTLQMNTEQNANLRQLMAGVSTIGATPGLTGAQQQNAIQQLTSMYHTNSSLTSGFYGSAAYGLSTGQSGANITGQSTPGVNAAVASMPGGSTYQQYGDYLSYGQGGYTFTAAPTIQFFGGTGLPTQQGGLAMYGSNTQYQTATPGGTVNYANQLTGNNPIGNTPGTTGARPRPEFLPGGSP